MRIKSTVKTLLSATCLNILTLGAAHAATVTFDFTGEAPTGASEIYTSGGVDVRVTASSIGREATLARFPNDAIGVGTDLTADTIDDSALIAAGESIQFDFDTAVTLERTLIFESGTGFDAVEILNLSTGISTIFTVFDDESDLGADGISTVVIDLIPGFGTAFDPVGSSFLFTTVFSVGTGPGVAIKNITVSGVIAPVPLPASFTLLATLIGAGALRRRYKTPKT